MCTAAISKAMLSQQLIYRLACLGYDGTVRAYGSEVLMGKACEQKQIRMLVSPMLWNHRKAAPVAPPKPAEDEKMRPSTQAAPQAPPRTAVPAGVVPDLVNKPIGEARAIVAEMRARLVGQGAPAALGYEPQLLLLEIAREAQGGSSGTVLSQTPPANTPLGLRTTIEAIVAK